MMNRPGLGDKFELRTQPVFKETVKRQFDLTFASLEKDRSDYELLQAKAQSEYDQVKRNFDQASATLQRWMASPTAYAPNVTSWEREVAKMRTAVAALTAQMGALKAQIAECRQRLDAVPQVRSFLDAVHQKATLHYAVVALCDDKEIILVETRPATLP
jgi:chromosome segregation ATPase